MALIVVGCYATKLTIEPPTKHPTSREYHASFDSTWATAMQVIAVFPLTVIEKASGIINTDWTTRTVYHKGSIWRGARYGQVEEDVPFEVTDRFNILISRNSDSTSAVRIIRYVKARMYGYMNDSSIAPPGVWFDPVGEPVAKESSTTPEWHILDAIENCMRTGDPTLLGMNEEDGKVVIAPDQAPSSTVGLEDHRAKK
jgi:hypothetical protein